MWSIALWWWHPTARMSRYLSICSAVYVERIWPHLVSSPIGWWLYFHRFISGESHVLLIASAFRVQPNSVVVFPFLVYCRGSHSTPSLVISPEIFDSRKIVFWLLCGGVRVVLRLAVSVEHRLVICRTDTHDYDSTYRALAYSVAR